MNDHVRGVPVVVITFWLAIVVPLGLAEFFTHKVVVERLQRIEDKVTPVPTLAPDVNPEATASATPSATPEVTKTITPARRVVPQEATGEGE